MELNAYLRGFGISFGLIAAIGAQNAYVLSRGLQRNHHWLVALLGACIDAILLSLGMFGMGRLVQQYPGLVTFITLGGVVFLLVYGGYAFNNMRKPASLRASGGAVSLRQAVLSMLALSLLNPHVYLDTVVFLAGIGVQEAPPQRVVFAAGAITASFVWFFSLAWGAQCLHAWFEHPATWRWLDGFIGVVMWSIAYSLLLRVW